MKWIDSHNFPKVIGGYCAVLSAVLSVLQIMEHLSAFIDPDVQSRIIRILVMVPLYGVTSYIGMNCQSSTHLVLVLDLIRDSYESYAIYTFFSLMMGLLGGTDALLRELMAEGSEPLTHPAPFCKMRPYSFSPTTLHRIRVSILQFMVLKPLCAVISIILDLSGRYKQPDHAFDFNYVWRQLGGCTLASPTSYTGIRVYYVRVQRVNHHCPVRARVLLPVRERLAGRTQPLQQVPVH